MQFQEGDFILYDLQMKLNDDKLKLRRGTRIGADSPLLGLPKGSLQVCLGRARLQVC